MWMQSRRKRVCKAKRYKNHCSWIAKKTITNINTNIMQEVLFHKIIYDPPTKYVTPNKKGKLDKEGKVKKDGVSYLTNNIFYGGVHFAVRNKIVLFSKEWIVWFLKDIPKMRKCSVEITYHHPTDTFDLDNKVGYWAKIILDLLKTPTQKQIDKAIKYKNPIISLNVLDDDTVRYIDEIVMRYKKGESAIELKITGYSKEEQQTLF